MKEDEKGKYYLVEEVDEYIKKCKDYIHEVIYWWQNHTNVMKADQINEQNNRLLSDAINGTLCIGRGYTEPLDLNTVKRKDE